MILIPVVFWAFAGGCSDSRKTQAQRIKKVNKQKGNKVFLMVHTFPKFYSIAP
jgi:hypothetical protein